MKRYVIVAAMLFAAVAMMAVPAKKGQWRMITLTDGTQVRAELCGDEYLHYMRDVEGNVYVKHVAGNYELANDDALQARARTRATTANGRRRARARKSNGDKGYHGSKKGLVILVDFSDASFTVTNPKATFSDVLNKVDYKDGDFKGSVRDYFADQSNGEFLLNFDVVGPVLLSKPSTYYGENDTDGYDLHPGEMVIEACKAVDDQVDFSNYVWGDDKTVNQVYVVYAGMGENDGGEEESIWPHEYTLTEAEREGDGEGPIILDGVTIDTYACGSELNGSEKLCGVGLICHEFSHCLGLPDMYDVRPGGNNFGMGAWDLMDSGNYNGDGYCPAGYTSYEKWWAGWLTPIELNLDAVQVNGMKALSENGDAYVIYNDSRRHLGIEGEYYLLENRQLTGWDAKLWGSGLLVVHVDYDEEAWRKNKVNTVSSRQRCTVIKADNSNYFLEGDTYPYEDNNSLTNTSIPKALLYNANTDNGYLMNKPVTGITQNNDGTISFKYEGNMNPTSIRSISIDDDNCNMSVSGDRIFSIDGRYVGTDFNALSPGIYIVNGKMVVR